MLLNIHERFLLMVELGICLTLWIMTLIQLRRLRESVQIRSISPYSVRMRENTDQKKTFDAVAVFLNMFIFLAVYLYFVYLTMV